MTTDATLDVIRMHDTTWHILNATAAGRQRLLAALPEAEREIVAAGTTGPGFDIEQARRRKTLANVLTVSYPVTFFAYYARTGAEGLHSLLEGEHWRGRSAQPGSAFPPAASTSAAFSAHLRTGGWPDRQEEWVREAFRFEDGLLFGATMPGAARTRLVPGAWAVEASFDVPEYATVLRERGATDPWPEALLLTKRRPAPIAVVSVPADGRVRRLRLRGDEVAALRWLWDDRLPVPEDAAGSVSVRRAVAAGIVAAGIVDGGRL
ncbi:hypothetical protein ACFXKW_19365 [Streptomyces sp. NPDC059193]|uniref:hypothetical protein n=1 Tax=Streptomyces sp. NPDC059193 TaxID=3346763 RepID=UPI0036842DF0